MLTHQIGRKPTKDNYFGAIIWSHRTNQRKHYVLLLRLLLRDVYASSTADTSGGVQADPDRDAYERDPAVQRHDNLEGLRRQDLQQHFRRGRRTRCSKIERR